MASSSTLPARLHRRSLVANEGQYDPTTVGRRADAPPAIFRHEKTILVYKHNSFPCSIFIFSRLLCCYPSATGGRARTRKKWKVVLEMMVGESDLSIMPPQTLFSPGTRASSVVEAVEDLAEGVGFWYMLGRLSSPAFIPTQHRSSVGDYGSN